MSNRYTLVAGQLSDEQIALLPLKSNNNKTLVPVSIDFTDLPDGLSIPVTISEIDIDGEDKLPCIQFVARNFLGNISYAPLPSANAFAQPFVNKTLLPGDSDSTSGINWDFNSAEFLLSISAIDPLTVLTANVYANTGAGDVLVATWIPTLAIGGSFFTLSPFMDTVANISKKGLFPVVFKLEYVASGSGAGVTFSSAYALRNI